MINGGISLVRLAIKLIFGQKKLIIKEAYIWKPTVSSFISHRGVVELDSALDS